SAQYAVEFVGRSQEQQPRVSVGHRGARLGDDRRLGARTGQPAPYGAVEEDDGLRPLLPRRGAPPPHDRREHERPTAPDEIAGKLEHARDHAAPSTPPSPPGWPPTHAP